MKLLKFVPVAFLLISAGILQGCQQKTEKQPLDEPPKVTVEEVGIVDTVQTTTYSGSIVPDNITDISFAVSGTINKVAVNEGQHVKKGQFLAGIDPTEYEAALQIANANLEQTEDAFRRFDELYKKGSFPEKDYIEIKTKLAKAKANKKIKAKRVADSKLFAPTNGIISSKMAEVGGTAAPGIPAFTLVKTDLVYARFTVPESEIGNFKSGMKTEVHVPTLNRSFTGNIAIINPLADQTTKTFTIKIRLNNHSGVMLPGMIAGVVAEVPLSERKIQVSLTSIIKDVDNLPYVYVITDNNIAKLRRVVVGKISGDAIVVTEGLSKGETIIVEGQDEVQDGQSVTLERETNDSQVAVQKAD